MYVSLKSAALVMVFSVAAVAQTGVTVVNWAGYSGTFPVAPGSIASAYPTQPGTNFGNFSPAQLQSVNPMPRELSGIRLRINNVDAPLYFVSAEQINFVVPNELTAGRHTAQVVQGGNVVAQGTVLIYDWAPGIATRLATAGNPQAAVVNQSGAINSEQDRARRGEFIQIYATGCGPTNPAVQTGVPPGAPASATASVDVTIYGELARIQYAGASPEFPGLCQINAFVPDLPRMSGRLPLYVTVSNIPANSGQPLTFWVQ